MAKLTEICSPKQWKTIGTSELSETGYPVYGANGIIGYYTEYNHEYRTLLITCRGATCGEINISIPKSYINGNAMCLDNLSEKYDLQFLYHYLKWFNFGTVITGSAQPQITISGLSKVNVPEFSVMKQREIATTLDKVTALIDMHKRQLELLDELVKSRFVELFGEPISNSMDWECCELGACLESIDNGKSYVCDNDCRTGDNPAILKLSAVTYGTYKPDENKAMIDEGLFDESAEVKDKDLLFTRKNTPELVGMSAYVFSTPPKLMMPDLIFRLNAKASCNKIYLWQLINHDLFRPCIQNIANGSAKSMSNISKERLSKLTIPIPPLALQQQFATFVTQTDKSKQSVQQSLEKLETLKKSLMQEYFG